MNYSIIGTGFISPRHIEAIYYTKGKIIDVINTAHGENTWKKAIKNPKADCIVILTPNNLHFKIALEAAKNKKMVLCEKPLTINSKTAEILSKYQNIFTVLQLRYHPLVKELKKKIKKNEKYEIEMDISVYRDKWYYKIWKGQTKRSGGVLFNLGIHYFDLLVYLFGEPKKTKTLTLNDKTGTGIIEGKNYNFSSKDNLSYENLHRFVYQNLVKKRGIKPQQALKSIKLVEKLSKKI